VGTDGEGVVNKMLNRLTFASVLEMLRGLADSAASQLSVTRFAYVEASSATPAGPADLETCNYNER